MAWYIFSGHFTSVHTTLLFAFIFGYPLQARRWIRTVSCSVQVFSLLLHTPISTLTALCFFYGCFLFSFSDRFRSLPKISIQLKSNLEHIKLLLSRNCNKHSVIYGKVYPKGLASSCTLLDCFSNPNAIRYYTILGLLADSEYWSSYNIGKLVMFFFFFRDRMVGRDKLSSLYRIRIVGRLCSLVIFLDGLFRCIERR